MIKTFAHKGLKELHTKGRTAKINRSHHERLIMLLDALEYAIAPTDMNFSGWYFHNIGGKPIVYSVRVNGNFRMTFEFNDGDAYQVWYGDYH